MRGQFFSLLIIVASALNFIRADNAQESASILRNSLPNVSIEDNLLRGAAAAAGDVLLNGRLVSLKRIHFPKLI
jgi:hypothetical protein